MKSRLECLMCGCPAALEDERDDWLWYCPNCGCGFVRLVLGDTPRPA